jgi:hypothetical protein
MKIRIVLTTASLTLLILALPQTAWAQSTTINAAPNQSNESQKKPRDANEYDQNAKIEDLLFLEKATRLTLVPTSQLTNNYFLTSRVPPSTS